MKTLHGLILFVFVLSNAAVLSGCGFKVDKTNDAPVTVGSVSFATVEKDVFAQSCVQCHAQQGGPDLTKYESAAALAAAIQSSVFQNHSMPKGGSLTAQQSAELQAWLAEGAPEVAGGPPAPQPSPVFFELPQLSWDAVNNEIFTPLCSKCHKNGQGVDLTTYPNVIASLAKVAAAIGEGTMPPKTPLSAVDRAWLETWINAGAPETAPGTAPIVATYDSINQNIFQPLCMNCHGVGSLQQHYPLEPYSALLAAKTKKGQPLLVPGNSAQSLLNQVLTTDDEDNRMPDPDSHLSRLPDFMTAIVQQWIDSGAPESVVAPLPSPSPSSGP